MLKSDKACSRAVGRRRISAAPGQPIRKRCGARPQPTPERRRAEPDPFLLRDLAINYDQRLVTLSGRPVELTATEYELLRLLALNAGRVMTYEVLLQRVWGEWERSGSNRVRAFV